MIVTATGSDGFRLWDATSGRQLGSSIPVGEGGYGGGAAISPDGTLVVTISKITEGAGGEIVDGKAILWTLDEDGQASLLKELGRGQFRYTEFSRDGTRLLASASNRRVQVWDVQSLALLNELGPSTSPPHRTESTVSTCAHFSPDGERVVSASGRHEVRRFGTSLTGCRSDRR